MNNPEGQSCFVCLYAADLSKNDAAFGKSLRCRRNPPAALKDAFRHPVVEKTDWCGEFTKTAR